MTGGTIKSSSDTPLILNRDVANSTVFVSFSNSTESLGNIGIIGYKTHAMYKNPVFSDNVNVYKIWHSGNDGSGSGLDADLLDGWELTSIVRTDNSTDFGSTSAVPSSFITGYTNTSANANTPYSYMLGNQCTVINVNRNGTDYGAQYAFGFGSRRIAVRSKLGSNTWSEWQGITAAEADMAAKLQKARTIWGQSFDGTKNVNGDLFFNNSNGIKCYSTTGEEIVTLYTSATNNLVIGTGHAAKGYDTYIQGNNIYLRYGTSHTRGLLLNSSGNITIGSSDLASTNYKMYVDGSCFFKGHIYHEYSSFRSLATNKQIGYAGAVNSEDTIYLHSVGSINFGSGGDNHRMYLNASGYLGIGTTSPTTKLHVVGTAQATERFYFGENAFFNSGGEGLYITKNGISWHNSSDAYVSSLFTFTSSYVAIAQSTTIDGNLLATGGVTMYSARKLKNITDERGLSLEELSVIKPTRFTWKDNRDEKIHIGGIADDVMKVLPEVIYKTDNDTLTMDYGNAAFAIAASLINPVINHEEEIRILKERIKELEEKVKVLTWNIA